MLQNEKPPNGADSDGGHVDSTWMEASAGIKELQQVLIRNKALPSLKGASSTSLGFLASVPAMGYATYFIGPTSQNDTHQAIPISNSTLALTPDENSTGGTEGLLRTTGNGMALSYSQGTGEIQGVITRWHPRRPNANPILFIEADHGHAFRLKKNCSCVNLKEAAQVIESAMAQPSVAQPFDVASFTPCVAVESLTHHQKPDLPCFWHAGTTRSSPCRSLHAGTTAARKQGLRVACPPEPTSSDRTDRATMLQRPFSAASTTQSSSKQSMCVQYHKRGCCKGSACDGMEKLHVQP